MDAHRDSILRLYHGTNSTEYDEGFMLDSATGIITSDKGGAFAFASDVKKLKEQYIPDFEGNIAYDSNNQVTAHGVMNKRNDGTCDIHLNIGILKMDVRSSSEIRFISVGAICNMFGIKSLSWGAAKTRVFSPYSEVAGIGSFTGYTGLMLVKSNDSAGFGRWYTGDNSVGMWGTSSIMYDAGKLYSIDIYGANWS